jgi:hypothetical protein
MVQMKVGLWLGVRINAGGVQEAYSSPSYRTRPHFDNVAWLDVTRASHIENGGSVPNG